MPSTRTSPFRRSRLLLPIVALVALAGLGLANLGSGDPRPDTERTAPETSAPDDLAASPGTAGGSPDMARREDRDPRALGDVDAPVVMVEWADFQCPFCGRFARETQPELVARYVEEGVLRIEWRDFPYLGPESTDAALASRAAAEQGAFWEFHEAVYAEVFRPNTGELSRENLLRVAADLGLDRAAFEATMDDPATAQAVQQEFAEARELGITGTPAFLVDGRPVLGAQPLDRFVELVEAAAEAP